MFKLTRDDLYRLENLPKNEDAVITALLRDYGGLFTDYVYFDESMIAKDSGLSRETIYLALKSLNGKHIVSFIPRKSTPLIRYAVDRVDGKDVILSEDIYDKRKEQFAKRIDAMIDYMKNDDECRSRQLLRYFGETDVNDCGQCDVCLRRKHEKKNGTADIRQAILGFLADGKQHFINELHKLDLSGDAVDKELERLIQEEIVEIDNSYIQKKK